MNTTQVEEEMIVKVENIQKNLNEVHLVTLYSASSCPVARKIIIFLLICSIAP